MKRRLDGRTGRLFRRGGASLMAAAMLGIGLSAAPSSGSTPGASVAAALGVYAGSGNVGGVNSLGQAIGSEPKYAMEFLDGSSWASISDPSYFTSEWQNSGYSMIWGVPMLPNAGATLSQGATGAYNGYFVTLAEHMVAAGQGSSMLRIGWEFNGGWFPWAANGQAANFVAYWQQIVNAMRSVSGANFGFEWNPTRGDLGVGNLADYYPGDAYVDVIGMDVYDTEWGTYPGAAAEFTSMETQPYGLNWLASFAGAHDKPITFPEWGLGWGPSTNGGPVSAPNEQVSGGDDPIFINDMAGWIASHNVLEATYWDYGSSSVASGANLNTLAALKQDFGPGAPVPVPNTPTPVLSSNDSATTLAISGSSANYGAEGTTQFSVTVSPTVNGPVKVNSTWTLCTATVTAGAGTCSLSNNDLNVGNYSLTAVYAGGGGISGSTSAPVPFSVIPRPVVLGLSVSPATVPYGSEESAAITAHVAIPTGGIAAGNVEVSSGAKPVCTIVLSNGSGTCSPSPAALDVGSDPLIGSYTGDSSDAAAVSHSALLVLTTKHGLWPLTEPSRLWSGLSQVGEVDRWDHWLAAFVRI